MWCVTDLHALEDCSSSDGHSSAVVLVVVEYGWLPCQDELPALSPGGECQPLSLLGHVRAVLDFKIKNFPFPFHENSSGKKFLKCLVAQ